MIITESKIKQIIREELDKLIEEKKDRCYKKAERKFKVFPSRYAGTYIARCRSGEIHEIADATLDDGTPVCEACLVEVIEQDSVLEEAKYHGRTVTLNKPTRGDVKKYRVFVKDPKSGNIKKVNFGDKNMEIKRDNPKRRKSFRARHKCSQAKDKTSPKYWSCKLWSNKTVSKIVK